MMNKSTAELSCLAWLELGYQQQGRLVVVPTASELHRSTHAVNSGVPTFKQSDGGRIDAAGTAINCIDLYKAKIQSQPLSLQRHGGAVQSSAYILVVQVQIQLALYIPI